MKNPGISLKELEDYTKMNRSTLRFHLNSLESESWIYSIKMA
jgi:predicted transcriptional regulator